MNEPLTPLPNLECTGLANGFFLLNEEASFEKLRSVIGEGIGGKLLKSSCDLERKSSSISSSFGVFFSSFPHSQELK
jgi:hypothetical protein